MEEGGACARFATGFFYKLVRRTAKTSRSWLCLLVESCGLGNRLPRWAGEFLAQSSYCLRHSTILVFFWCDTPRTCPGYHRRQNHSLSRESSGAHYKRCRTLRTKL